MESQLKGIEALATIPQSLPDVLRTVATLFPNRIEISDNAYATAESYAEEEPRFWSRAEGLAIAWEMVFGLATRLYELIFELESNRLEEEFGLSFSTFELALSEGKQTQKDAKLMALRKLQHDGQEFDMTPHVKYGNRSPKMLRLYYAVNREGKKLIVGHFGDHLDNFTTKTM